MGLTPIPMVATPARRQADTVARLERELRGRRSMLQSRRRRAYQACLALIVYREAACFGEPIPERTPWQESAVNYQKAFSKGMVVGGAGCIVATVDSKPSAPPRFASDRITK